MTEIFGQDRPLNVLRSALQSGRFHHAWIFSGPRGVGKFTAAQEIARVLLDPELPRELPATRRDTHVGKLIDAGTHPDLHIIRKELALYSDNRQLRERKQRNIPLDLLRERVIGGYSGEVEHQSVAYRTALLDHGKVFIIDEAELLDLHGQNALLKTLEEPPLDTFFFMITAFPDELLPTIRSRCQHVRFGPLDEPSMSQWSKAHLAAHPEQGKASSKAMEWVFGFAEGSPGLAMLALEHDFFAWHQSLLPMLNDLERGRFPAGLGGALHELVQNFAELWVKRHKNASKDAANKDGASHVFAILSDHARQRLLDAASSGNEAMTRWPIVIDVLREAERNLDSNVNMRHVMDNLVAQWFTVMTCSPHERLMAS